MNCKEVEIIISVSVPHQKVPFFNIQMLIGGPCTLFKVARAAYTKIHATVGDKKIFLFSGETNICKKNSQKNFASNVLLVHGNL